MRESFVFHADFIDHLPEELKTEWAMYCINYGLFDIEPQFENVLVAELWRKLKTRIDTDKGAYEKRLSYTQLYNEYKKQLKSGAIAKDTTFETFQTFKTFENNSNISTESRREYDSESVYESVYDSVSEYESESVSDATELPSKDAPSTINYSKIVFELFKDASLPCAKGNEISFLQTDFKNGLNYLHKTSEFQHIQSDDVIGAVKNYIEVLQNPDCYVSNRMNFFQLVKSKNFYNYLPQNFDVENFHNFGTTSSKTQSDDVFKDYEKKYISSPCSKCGGTRIFLNPNIKKWICDDCFGQFPFSSYKGDAK